MSQKPPVGAREAGESEGRRVEERSRLTQVFLREGGACGGRGRRWHAGFFRPRSDETQTSRERQPARVLAAISLVRGLFCAERGLCGAKVYD